MTATYTPHENTVAKISPRERQEALASHERLQKWELGYATARTLIRYSFFAWAVHEGLLAIQALAHGVTIADISVGLKLLGKEHAGSALLFVGWIVSTGWALLERRLRKRTIKRLAPKVAEVETLKDPSRSTSSLTSTGDTIRRTNEPSNAPSG